MSELHIDDYGQTIETSAKQYLEKANHDLRDNLVEVIDQAYYQGSDDKADEFANNIMVELFLDAVANWMDNINKQSPQFDNGLTQATINQLNSIADQAGMNCLVNDIDLEEASQYFKEHYGDTDLQTLYEKLKDHLR